MSDHLNYIATWFYKESKEEASYYPQVGGKGDSELVHSIYMKIQVPFFTTFRHYHSDAHLLFYTNLHEADLPQFLNALFQRLHVEIVTLPYQSKPPKGWHNAWQNQFYVYDILKDMERRMRPTDTILICDADCLCHRPLNDLLNQVYHEGSALYELATHPQQLINGTTLQQMNEFYSLCYHKEPEEPIYYYGGEFIALRGDIVKKINAAFPALWAFNIGLKENEPRLHEEAHVLSILAEQLHFRNANANRYIKRMWTNPNFTNVIKGDENFSVWHLPYEKKRGLYYLYKLLQNNKTFPNETEFWQKAGLYCGIPQRTPGKKLMDLWETIRNKMQGLCH